MKSKRRPGEGSREQESPLNSAYVKGHCPQDALDKVAQVMPWAYSSRDSTL